MSTSALQSQLTIIDLGYLYNWEFYFQWFYLSLPSQRELKSIWPTSRSDQKHKNVIYQMVFHFFIWLKLIFEEKDLKKATSGKLFPSKYKSL